MMISVNPKYSHVFSGTRWESVHKGMLYIPRGRLYTRFYWILLFICILFIIIYSQNKAYSHSTPQETSLHFIPYNSPSPKKTQSTQCEVKHIVLLCTGSEGTRETTFLLETILQFRQAPLHLHILADPIGNASISLLLDTWQLPAVSYTIYILPDLRTELEFATTTLLALHHLIPRSVEKVLVLHPRMRFLSDVNELFEKFIVFTQNQYIGITRGAKTVKDGPFSFIHRYFADVILLDLHKIRNKMKNREDNEIFTHWLHLHSYLEKLSNDLYILPCIWNTRLDVGFDYEGCIGNKNPKALFYGNQQSSFTNIQRIETAKEIVYNIINSNGEVWRTTGTACFLAELQDVKSLVTKEPDDPCAQFRYITKLKRRTHIYFYAGEKCYVPADDYDITLVTQFTIDRFQIFVRFASLWQGPIVAVLHASDDEAARLVPAILSTRGLNRRDNVAVHIVYKREKFYPINYLRNVGLSHVNTPYTIFVDVDLLPNADAYTYLKKLLAERKSTAKPRDLWILPAFETSDASDYIPRNRSELLNAMSKGKMIGYRMDRGWKLGHQPVNYPYWVTAEGPYRIAYQNAFEPYVLGLTSMLPLYEESLLERMADKISYARHLYTAGFIFRVVDQAFLVHLPHPKSEGTAYWSSHKSYFKCGSVLSEEFARRINFTKPLRKTVSVRKIS